MLTCPFISVAEHLGLPPTATCAALNLWNSVAISSIEDASKPEDLVALQTFTGTPDESWFYVVSDAIEIRGGRVIPVMLDAINSAHLGDAGKVSESLCALAECLRELEVLLGRMYEKCSPEVFYHDIRRFIAGSNSISGDSLPEGVFYDEGQGKGSWRKYSGGSNAQSSLIPFFDIVLGVHHRPTGQSITSDENGFMKV
jgi:indoleamine 2,3-dioxygenase